MSTPDPAPGKLIVIAGPAGSGKTTLCERMLAEQPDVRRVITCTTRAPREGEVDGRDYYFLSPEEFERRIEAGDFYEYARVHGRYYGTLKSEIDRHLSAGRNVLLNIDVQGAASFRQAERENPSLAGRLVTVFITITPGQMRERMLGRGDNDEAEIARRLKSAEDELARAGEFDHVIASTDRESDYQRLLMLYRHLTSPLTGR
ncbi:guanylate kinase [Ruficoccus amylovorans]|uniref:Guanylate kinase n=1 Tax=Ruficoccus amylovorans TaxID=1804625 RepID=A0A842HG68_9BACT|nr:guanylate kinase [Ruficoccus amylovorans]MBC2595523.1 guanylate kinase [Ruficoccus amylovorans]